MYRPNGNEGRRHRRWEKNDISMVVGQFETLNGRTESTTQKHLDLCSVLLFCFVFGLSWNAAERDATHTFYWFVVLPAPDGVAVCSVTPTDERGA